jgi:hypothetical protein
MLVCVLFDPALKNYDVCQQVSQPHDYSVRGNL